VGGADKQEDEHRRLLFAVGMGFSDLCSWLFVLLQTVAKTSPPLFVHYSNNVCWNDVFRYGKVTNTS